ncbi:UNVERIFIED_CONTAM: hypothetical protein FKN15_071373 [Acipenser sinensis]
MIDVYNALHSSAHQVLNLEFAYVGMELADAAEASTESGRVEGLQDRALQTLRHAL